MKTWRAVTAWIALFLAAVACSFAIEIEHNVMSWHPQGFTIQTVAWMTSYAVTLFAMVLIAPSTRTCASVFTMWSTLALLALLGLSTFPADDVPQEPKPRAASPLPYRVSHGTALLIPALLVGWRRRRAKVDRPDAA